MTTPNTLKREHLIYFVNTYLLDTFALILILVEIHINNYFFNYYFSGYFKSSETNKFLHHVEITQEHTHKVNTRQRYCDDTLVISQNNCDKRAKVNTNIDDSTTRWQKPELRQTKHEETYR